MKPQMTTEGFCKGCRRWIGLTEHGRIYSHYSGSFEACTTTGKLRTREVHRHLRCADGSRIPMFVDDNGKEIRGAPVRD